MTHLKIFAAAAALGVGACVTLPASAQEVVYNPGYCAQFYPNANCQNKGRGNPLTDPNFRRGGWNDGYAMMGHRDKHQPPRHRMHGRH
jgi:hypothetical protein